MAPKVLNKADWFVDNEFTGTTRVADVPSESGNAESLEIPSDAGTAPFTLAVDPVVGTWEAVQQSMVFWAKHTGTSDLYRLNPVIRRLGGTPGTSGYQHYMNFFGDPHWQVVPYIAATVDPTNGQPDLAFNFTSAILKGNINPTPLAAPLSGWNKYVMYAGPYLSSYMRWCCYYLDRYDNMSLLYDIVDDWSTLLPNRNDAASWSFQFNPMTAPATVNVLNLDRIEMSEDAFPDPHPLASGTYDEGFEDIDDFRRNFLRRTQFMAGSDKTEEDDAFVLQTDNRPGSAGTKCLEVSVIGTGGNANIESSVIYGKDKRITIWLKTTRVSTPPEMNTIDVFLKHTGPLDTRSMLLNLRPSLIDARGTPWRFRYNIGGADITFTAPESTSNGNLVYGWQNDMGGVNGAWLNNTWYGYRLSVIDAAGADMTVTLEININGGGWNPMMDSLSVNQPLTFTVTKSELHGVRAGMRIYASNLTGTTSDALRIDDLKIEKL
jgi:hypothetical protein